MNGEVVKKPRGDRRPLEQVALDLCSKIAEQRKTGLFARATYPDGREQWVQVASDGSARALTAPPDEYRAVSAVQPGTGKPLPLPPPAPAAQQSEPAGSLGARDTDHRPVRESTRLDGARDRTRSEDAEPTTPPSAADDQPTVYREPGSIPRILPTPAELLAAADTGRVRPAQYGWRSWLRLPPGPAELEVRRDVAAIQSSLDGPKNITVVNPKGGVGKTTAVRQLAATLGRRRGGYVLAWDNNPTRGNLGSRTIRSGLTVVELLADLTRFENEIGARVGDLSNYVRSQGDDQFDVLSSSRSTARMKAIDEEAFNRLDDVLDRFYRIKVVDSGNDMTRANYTAALDRTDQLVIVAEVAEDAAEGAAEMVDDFRALGRDHLVDHAVVVLTGTARTNKSLANRLSDYFGAHSRAVFSVPFDPSLVGGRLIQQSQLSKATVRSWERVSAEVVRGLA